MAGEPVAQKQLGSVKLLTPVRASRKQEAQLGSTQVLTPVRRSARKMEGGGKWAAGGAEALLEVTNFSYAANPELQGGPDAAAEGRGDSA